MQRSHRGQSHIRPRSRWVQYLVLLILSFSLLTSALAESPDLIMVLEVRGVIDPVVAQYVERGIRAAHDENASLVVIQLDTPGGLDTAMRKIVQAILNSDIPIVVSVAPSGARAASAGVFITMAAHVAAMAPGTNIGAAHPVDMSQGEMPATMEDKVTNDAVAYVRAIAEQRGRNADWAEQAVRQSASLTAQAAREQDVIDLMAEDLPALLKMLDGYPVSLNGEEVVLQLESPTIEPYAMTWFERAAHGLIDPNIAYILLTLGTLALIAEFYNPGAILPGVSGVIALVLAFIALGSLPVNWGGVVLIIIALAFFLADIKVPGFALSVAGVISFILGSLFLFSPFTPTPPTMPRLSVSPWLLVTMTAIIVGFFTIAVTAGLRAQRRASLTGTHMLVGQTGIVLSDLNPRGVVQVQSETWTAITAEGPIPAGETIKVIGVDGLHVLVRPLQQKD
ncbi:MAG TPA: nodulation protein NfeD [Caldilineae bacterium]|nr:nodulation protein NfeD [Caldilineae bacterium]